MGHPVHPKDGDRSYYPYISWVKRDMKIIPFGNSLTYKAWILRLYLKFVFWTFLERGVQVLGKGGQVLGKGIQVLGQGVQEPGYSMLPSTDYFLESCILIEDFLKYQK